jgi:hypothetical protein
MIDVIWFVSFSGDSAKPTTSWSGWAKKADTKNVSSISDAPSLAEIMASERQLRKSPTVVTETSLRKKTPESKPIVVVGKRASWRQLSLDVPSSPTHVVDASPPKNPWKMPTVFAAQSPETSQPSTSADLTNFKQVTIATSYIKSLN